MNLSNCTITISLTPQDQALLEASGETLPNFWAGHLYEPLVGDLLRFGRWQAPVLARTWEHNGTTPVLVLSMGAMSPRTDGPVH